MHDSSAVPSALVRRAARLWHAPGTLWEMLSMRALQRYAPPAVFHVTHYKAGSQWILAILRTLARHRVVTPEVGSAQFLKQPVRPGGVYPTLYVTREQFESVRLPERWRRFVVIRDLRDTLVSSYFSLKVSHSALHSEMDRCRNTLTGLSVEDGMIWLCKWWLARAAGVQRSWAAAGEPLIKYEDLLAGDLDILERVLIRDCGLRVSRVNLRAAVLTNRFEARTRGRRRGTEDPTQHERKGVAGDWRNYFTDKLARHFKDLYGELLVATGYETDDRW